MYNLQDWATNLSTTPVRPLLRSLLFGRCQDRMSREPYSLLSDQGERPIPTLSFSDTEEFCLACMLTCVAECRVGGREENMSSKPFIMLLLFHLLVTGGFDLTWHPWTVWFLRLMPTERLSPHRSFFFAPGEKSWEAETGEGRGQTKREKTGGEWNPRYNGGIRLTQLSNRLG